MVPTLLKEAKLEWDGCQDTGQPACSPTIAVLPERGKACGSLVSISLTVLLMMTFLQPVLVASLD